MAAVPPAPALPVSGGQPPSPRLCFVSDLSSAESQSAIQEKVEVPQEQSTLFVHHFGVTQPLLAEWLKNSRFGPPTADHIFDTAHFLLMRSNVWLRQRRTECGTTEWNLKRLTPEPRCPQALAIGKVSTLSSEIVTELRALGLRGFEDLELVASIPFRRAIVTEDKDSRLWVDCALIADKYYVIGGCSYSTLKGLEALRRRLVNRPGYIQWVRSKVLESLFVSRKELYDGLVGINVLSSLPYHDAHALMTPPETCQILKASGDTQPCIPTVYPTRVPTVPLFPSEALELQRLRARYQDFKPPKDAVTPWQELQFFRCTEENDDWNSD